MQTVLSAGAAHLQGRQRQCKGCNEVPGEVRQVDQPAHISLVNQLELVPEAVSEGDAMGLAGRHDTLEQVGIVRIPAALLQAALHAHTHHLPL